MAITSKTTVPRTDYASLLRTYSTEELAALLHIRPQSIRASLCRSGSLMGLRPVKLPNGRLLWPADEADRLISGEGAQ